MKVCPVCKGKVFDDMNTCYNCLHRFDEERIAEDTYFESDFFEPHSNERESCSTFEKSTSSDENKNFAYEGDVPVFMDFLKKFNLFLSDYLKSFNCS